MSDMRIADSDDLMLGQPLTSGKPPIDPRMKYHFGRGKIQIPLSEESLNEVTIQRYLPHILYRHAINAGECMHFENVYRGNSHIFDKRRDVNPDKKNTFINENHAFYMVEFKKGFMYGEPIKYASVDDTTSVDDISYLNKYMVEQLKASKDVEVGEAIFKYGNAYRMVLPKPYSKNRNLEKEAPYKLYNLDNTTTFVVYSSNFDKSKLFGGIITTVDSPYPEDIRYEIMIYTRTEVYRFRCWSLCPTWDGIDFISKSKHYLEYVPIVESYTNTARLGVIDIVETILDAINDISSDCVDNINDYINSILAIYNMDVDQQTHDEIKAFRSISVKTTDPSRPADAKYLTNALSQSDVIVKYEALLKVAYNIAGVPIPTTKSTSGGDTGDARELAGGWENANILAKQNEEPLKQAERMLLEIVLSICRKTPNCPVDELYPSDIDINFNRTHRNNLMSKMQSIKYGFDMNMPLEGLLNIANVTSNPHEFALEWENNINRKREEAMKIAEQQKNVIEEDNEDIEETEEVEDSGSTQEGDS